MALDMFMRIEGVSGESKDSNHKAWTDIQSFKWGAEQPGSMSSGGGGGAGKVNFDDLIVVSAIDKAAPTVLKNCSVGQHLGKVENQTRYSLIISLETPAQDIELYSTVKNMIEVPIEIQV